MKISLLVGELYGGLRAFKIFMIKGPRFAGPIKFIIDSGSPDTLIGTMDASRLNIPISNLPLPEDKKVVGLDGVQIILKLIKDLTLLSADEHGETVRFSMLVYVNAKPVPKIRGQETQGNPSVLGVDFLLKNKLKFVFDPIKEIAYLESS